MALPWLTHPKQAGGISTEVRKPDSDPKEDQDGGLKAAARDLISAMESKDESRLASALRAAFQILDSEESQPLPTEEQE